MVRVDLSAITKKTGGAIAEFVEFLIPCGGRAEMLLAGISRIATPYFAVLDDDDFWMSDHFEELFRVGWRVREDFDVAFSGSIGVDFPIRYNATQSCNRNIFRFGSEPEIADPIDVQNAIGTNCFVARADLLMAEMRQVPQMRTAEDSLLICLLAWRSKPIFSYRPTAFYRRDAADGPNWQTDEQRTEDEISRALRAGLVWTPGWLASDSFAMRKRISVEARHKLGRTLSGEYIDRLSVGTAGRRTENGIATLPRTSGHVCYGPYIHLPPDRCRASFLIEREYHLASSREPLGTVEIVADIANILAECRIESNDEEIVLPFLIEPGMALSKIEFRVASKGTRPFTLASLMLHRDGAKSSPSHPAEPRSKPVAVSGQSPPPARQGKEAHALEAELAAMRASTSWRITAPLRRLGRLAHRLRG